MVTPLPSAHDFRKIVHFGPGEVPPGSPLGRAIHKNEVHYCIDLDTTLAAKKEWRKVLAHYDSSKTLPVSLIRADITRTQLPDEFADEIHMHDVLNELEAVSDRSKPWNASIRHPMPNIIASPALTEAKRVLKANGKIFVGVANTPSDLPAAQLKRMARQSGFSFKLLASDNGKPPADSVLKVLERHAGKAFATRAYAGSGYYLAELKKKA